MKNKFNLVLLAALLSGCAQQNFDVNRDSNAEPTKTVTQHFVFSGLGQAKTIDVASVCGGAENISKIETQYTFGNAVLGTLSLGIYTPWEARVYCEMQ